MNTSIKHFVRLFIVAVIAVVTVNVTVADDVNPPAYRGDPLSVYAHWQNVPGTPFVELDPTDPTQFNYWDDSDPTTYLSTDYPLSIQAGPSSNNSYLFDLPNFVDDLPIKYLRIQVTWEGSGPAPTIFGLSGIDPTGPVDVAQVFSSPIALLPPGFFYQYHDFELKPNPDFERWAIQMPDNSLLIQVVADSISTVPEPATMALLGLGGLLLRKRR